MPSFEVELPPPSADRPARRKIVLSAIVGLSFGLLLAWASLGAAPPEQEGSRDAAQAPAEEIAAEGAQTEEEAGEDTSVEDSGAEEEVAGEQPDEETPTEEHAAEETPTEEVATEEEVAEEETEPDPPAAEPATIPPSELRVRRGRVAYLRCAGVERRGQRFPCPRDTELEDEVWPRIEALLSCEDPPGAPGRADIRLDFEGEGAPAIDFRDRFSNTDVRVDPERTVACLREPLGALRQRLGAARLTISFRFEVERR